jgi:hypothetical protein
MILTGLDASAQHVRAARSMAQQKQAQRASTACGTSTHFFITGSHVEAAAAASQATRPHERQDHSEQQNRFEENFGRPCLDGGDARHGWGERSFSLRGQADPHQLQRLCSCSLSFDGHLLLFVTQTERWFFLPPFPGGTTGHRDLPDPGRGGSKFWLARSVDPMVPDRIGVALQYRLDVRPRRRSTA